MFYDLFKFGFFFFFGLSNLEMKNVSKLAIIGALLSNDPGKNCTIFYCFDAISFPHIETVVFLGQEFLN